jgi:hypothetical protein
VTNPISLPPLLLYVVYSSPPWLYVILHFLHDWSSWSPSFSSTIFQNFQVFLIYFPTCPGFSTIHCYTPVVAHHYYFSQILKSSFLEKRYFFLLNATFAMTVLHLILRVHHASFIVMLKKQLKYSTFFSSWSIITCIGDGSLEILITIVFLPLISVAKHLPHAYRMQQNVFRNADKVPPHTHTNVKPNKWQKTCA